MGEYNINEHGFHKRSAGPDESDSDEKGYRCASHEMHIFGPIGNGASNVVERAIFIPVHRILALKKINIFEKVRILFLMVKDANRNHVFVHSFDLFPQLLNHHSQYFFAMKTYILGELV